jgi:hypothetical protein
MHKKVLFTLVTMLLPGLVNAHHSHASLNKDDQRVMTGVVTEYLWRSPHVYLKANVLNSSGTIVEYTVEMSNPMSMGRAGWNKNTIKAGDRITWQGAHDRDPERAYMGLSWLENQSGARTYISAAAQKQYLEENGQEIPGFLSDQGAPEPALLVGEGTWQRIAKNGGRFANIYTPEPIVGWPLTDFARDMIENFSEGDNPFNRCIITGPPRAMLTLPKFQWARRDDVITIDRDLWSEKRIIHLDKEVTAIKASAFGHSIGWFEDDVLHVESDYFTSEPWALFWGLDSSNQLSLHERYWLSEEGMRLNLEFTITDPVMLAEPVTMTHQWKKIADSDITHAECSEENANFFITAGYD